MGGVEVALADSVGEDLEEGERTFDPCEITADFAVLTVSLP